MRPRSTEARRTAVACALLWGDLRGLGEDLEGAEVESILRGPEVDRLLRGQRLLIDLRAVAAPQIAEGQQRPIELEDRVEGRTKTIGVVAGKGEIKLSEPNLISARPLMGPAGAGSLAQVVNAAIGNKARFDEMREFFGDTGQGFKAGVWSEVPEDRPEFREHYKRHLVKLARQRKAEEMV